MLRWGFFALTALTLLPVAAMALPIATEEFSQQEIKLTPKQRVLQDALAALRRGKYDDAIRKAEAALADDATLAPAHEIIGAALTLQGDLDGGLMHLRMALKIDPDQSSAHTKIGDIYLAQEDLKAAKKEFLSAIRLNPKDRYAHQRLGIIYDRENDTAKAIEHYEQGLRGTPPGYLGIKVDLGRLYNQTGVFQETVDLLADLIPAESKNTTAHIVLGTAYLGLNRTEDAIREFRLARKLEPDTERAALSLGIAYRQSGDLRRSEEELKEVVRLRPKWSTGYFQLGETYAALKDFGNAETNYRTAEKYSPNPLFIKKRRAQLYLEQKATQKAIALYKEIIQSGNADVNTFELLGTAYQLTGEMDLAEKTFLEMKQKFPDNPFCNYRLGIYYGFTRQYDKAVAELQTALAKAPKDSLVLKALSTVYSRMGDNENAIQTARQLVEVQPGNAEALFLLAALHQDNGELEKAEEIYGSVLEQNPKHALALNNLADLLARREKLDQAEIKARQAVELAPDNGMILDTYGWILYRKGDLKQANHMLMQAEQKMPGHPTILYHLGVVANELGEKERARQYLERALHRSDDFKYRKAAEQLLESL